jgi:SRSO17 transposase
MDDKMRRDEARIPWDVQFATKPELGLQLIRRALDDHIPPGLVLADKAYGASDDFRERLREMGCTMRSESIPRLPSWSTTSVDAAATRE